MTPGALSDEQREFRDRAIAFAERKLNAGAKEREKRCEFDTAGWLECAEFGIQGLCMPEEYGGLGRGVPTCVATMEGLGRGCKDGGLLFALNSHIWTCEAPILRFGSEAQRRKYLPDLIRGRLKGGHAMTEAESGSDAFSMRCSAVKRGAAYVLNGAKVFITNAPIADVLLVFAVTNPHKKFGGVSTFLVEKGRPGMSVSKPFEMMGLKTCPIGEVVLEDCEVPEENRLGPEGAGSAIFNSEMEWERSCLSATHLGSMEKILQDCVRYASERRQFGKPIGKYQAVAHKIADMKVRCDLSRLVLYRVVALKAAGQRAPLEAAMAKLFVSESYVQSCQDAVQIHGAYGFSAEFELERSLRDAIGSKIYSGTSEIQRNIIAAMLGL